MSKNLLIFSLLPVLCFGQASAKDVNAEAEDTKLFGDFVKDQTNDVPLLEGLTVDGELKFGFVTSNQSLSGDVDNPTAFLDGDVNLNYKKVIDGIGWGFKIKANARSGLVKQGSAIVDTSYLFADTDKLGEFRIGYSKSAGSIFSVSYADIMTGYNLIDSGNASCFFAQTAGTILGTGFDKDDGKCLKFVWISPTVKGWKLGFSYAPNSRDGHLFKERRNKSEKDFSYAQNFADESAYIEDSFTAGISYEYGDPEAFNAKVAVAGWLAQGKSSNPTSRVRNVQGYNVGAILGYGKYKLGLGYTDNINSMIPKTLGDTKWKDEGGLVPGGKQGDEYIVGMGGEANAGKIYNVGVGYFGDKWEMSAGYFQAEKKWSPDDKATSKIATVAVQYNIDKMVSAFVEYNNIRTECADRIYYSEIYSETDNGTKANSFKAYGRNRANMFIVGAKINL